MVEPWCGVSRRLHSGKARHRVSFYKYTTYVPLNVMLFNCTKTNDVCVAVTETKDTQVSISSGWYSGTFEASRRQQNRNTWTYGNSNSAICGRTV